MEGLDIQKLVLLLGFPWSLSAWGCLCSRNVICVLGAAAVSGWFFQKKVGWKSRTIFLKRFKKTVCYSRLFLLELLTLNEIAV